MHILNCWVVFRVHFPSVRWTHRTFTPHTSTKCTNTRKNAPPGSPSLDADMLRASSSFWCVSGVFGVFGGGLDDVVVLLSIRPIPQRSSPSRRPTTCSGPCWCRARLFYVWMCLEKSSKISDTFWLSNGKPVYTKDKVKPHQSTWIEI